MIDPRLTMLQMVDHHGSVTAAAEAMSYTPSAVSYQLRQLSSHLGVQLIEPAGRGIRLTSGARIVLRHLAAMQEQWEQARSELAADSDTLSGRFTLCGFSTAATFLLPPAAAALRDHHPALDLRLVEADPNRCFELLLAGEADLGLIVATADTPPLTDARFDQQHVIDEPLDLAVPAQHPLATRSTVSLAEASRETWITAASGSTYHELVVSACLAAGFTPQVVHHADEWDTGAAIVAQGFAVMLVPRLFHVNPEWPVARIPLAGEPAPVRRILAVTRRGAGAHPAIAETLQLVQATSRALLQAGIT
jgi:DNA-binding transcriptional LysR family regulator